MSKLHTVVQSYRFVFMTETKASLWGQCLSINPIYLLTFLSATFCHKELSKWHCPYLEEISLYSVCGINCTVLCCGWSTLNLFLLIQSLPQRSGLQHRQHCSVFSETDDPASCWGTPSQVLAPFILVWEAVDLAQLAVLYLQWVCIKDRDNTYKPSNNTICHYSLLLYVVWLVISVSY